MVNRGVYKSISLGLALCLGLGLSACNPKSEKNADMTGHSTTPSAYPSEAYIDGYNPPPELSAEQLRRFREAPIYEMQEVSVPAQYTDSAVQKRPDWAAPNMTDKDVIWADDSGFLAEVPFNLDEVNKADREGRPPSLPTRDVVWHGADGSERKLLTLEGMDQICHVVGNGRFLVIASSIEGNLAPAEPVRVRLWDLQAGGDPVELVSAPESNAFENGSFLYKSFLFDGDWLWFGYSQREKSNLDRYNLHTGEIQHIGESVTGSLAKWNGTVVTTALGTPGTDQVILRQYDSETGAPVPLDPRLEPMNRVDDIAATAHHLFVSETIYPTSPSYPTWVVPETGEPQITDLQSERGSDFWWLKRSAGDYLAVSANEGDFVLHAPSGKWFTVPRVDVPAIRGFVVGPMVYEPTMINKDIPRGEVDLSKLPPSL
ncbi:hypothetical protein [Actinobaculum suis]|uniref:hypothetical protein n=1 Tax=Actinobaculum suis TaxID=1657 RepID=UPI001147A3A7|nr:hypothetical protein [Actinobaculum suis]